MTQSIDPPDAQQSGISLDATHLPFHVRATLVEPSFCSQHQLDPYPACENQQEYIEDTQHAMCVCIGVVRVECAACLLICTGRPDVGELLLSDRVDLQVIAARAFPYDHATVHFCGRACK